MANSERTGAAGWLRDKTVLVAVAGVDLGAAIVAGLLEQGARVVLLTDNAALCGACPAAATAIPVGFDTRAEVTAAFAAAAQAAGRPDLVVLSAMPEPSARVRALVDQSDEEWRDGPHRAIRTTLYCLQAAGGHLKPHGGAVVLVGPSLALAGCAGLVGLTTALEGQRGLMKSVARQWGGSGVTLNWLACAPRALSPLFDAAPLASKTDAVPVALGRAPDLRSEIVPVIGFLGSPAGRVMTGATLTLDGGEWMLP